MSDAAPLLEVRDLHVQYPGRDGPARAVDGVSLTLGEGETLALVGESGCGKTTLARTIMGLLSPTSGEVRFRGEPLSYKRAGMREHRRHAQMIFQDPTGALNARQTLYEAVAEGIRIQGLEGNEEQLVADALARAGLRPPESFFTRYPHEFSGGQRQRLAIARALAVEPRLIVCDEPTSALDVSVQAQILNLLRQLQDELGVAYLFITHNFGVVEYLAHDIAVMKDGKIIEAGTAGNVLSRPQHAYTQALLSAVPRLRSMRATALGVS